MNATRRLHRRAVLALLAVLAYLPGLISAPGRLPADTKLYLTLDPGGLLGQATRTWDTSQFAGWVPHQSVAYLWPSGPWFWTFERLGVPMWIAQRLFVGTILFAAGTGIWWLCRKFGFGWQAAGAAAVAYQLSPYVLPYLSRTSAMLLPWAGLGWLLGVTVDATRGRGWSSVGWFGLIIATTGAVNLTATMMIAPAVVVWLVVDALDGDRSGRWRRLTGHLLRLGGAALACSVWWMATLAIQGKYGADVLSYSETLQATSATSTAPEVLRGLGYWLNYVNGGSGATTTAAGAYQSSVVLLAASFLLPIAGLVGLAVVRSTVRRFGAAILVVGVLLAVGVHPIDDPSPLFSPLAARSRSSLALIFRSSTRAIPLIALAMVLGLAALTEVVVRRRRDRRGWLIALVPVVAIAGLPGLWNRALVDPALTHPQRPPSEWRVAAAALGDDREHRVLQLPGVESQVFSWGYTVDPPLPGLTRRPFLSRDWLPLGSPGVMDLLYAFDDRFQQRTISPRAVVPILRLLGVDTVWLAADVDAARFGSVPPEVVAEVLDRTPGLQRSQQHGAISLYSVENPAPIVRLAERTLVVFGSGDGLIDAAAAGLIDGTEAVLFAADLSPSEIAEAVAAGAEVIVTDSNRARAHQWRGSQHVTGFTESGGADGGVLLADPQDARLPVFPTASDAEHATTAILDDGLSIRATRYGPLLELRPEQRPALAVDGDPNTAWIIGAGVNPVGQRLELSDGPGRLTIRQPDGVGRITAVRVTSGGTTTVVELNDTSLTGPGQSVAVVPGPLTVEISAVGAGTSFGIAELGVGTHPETVRTPPAAGDVPSARGAVVLSRLRDRTASTDPESSMRRDFTTPPMGSTVLSATVRLTPGGTPDAGCVPIAELDGRPLLARPSSSSDVSGVQGEAVTASGCGPGPVLEAGVHRLRPVAGVTVDQLVLATSGQADARKRPPKATVRRAGSDLTITTSSCPQGCWLVAGEGFSTGWQASVADARNDILLGRHLSISGGFNGWWIPPHDAALTIALSWPAQRLATAATLVSAVAVAGCLVLVLRQRKRRLAPKQPITVELAWRERATARREVPAWGATVLAVTGLAITVPGPWAVVGALLVALAGLLRRDVLAAVASVALVGAGCGLVVVGQIRRQWAAAFDWPAHFATAHHMVLCGVITLAAIILIDTRRSRYHRSDV